MSPQTINLAQALRRTAAGLPLIITDDARREHEGDFFVSAASASTQLVNTFITHGRGLLFAMLTPTLAHRLQLPLMVPASRNTEAHGCQFTVSVDSVDGTTGIAAHERARTLQRLADEATQPQDFRRPGHVFPIIAAPGGLHQRQGHTEACVTLCALAGLPPVAAGCEVLSAEGNSARGAALDDIAARLKIPIFTIADLMAQAPTLPTWPMPIATFVASARLPIGSAEFTVHAFTADDGGEHLALTLGNLASGGAVLTRVHSRCTTGDALHSARCDCRDQLAAALAAVTQAGRGVILYLDQEGRGIGLANKIRAYARQDHGEDTVAANLGLGLPADGRDYRVAAEMLGYLNVRTIDLLTNNPDKVAQLTQAGIIVSRRVPLSISPTAQNRSYLGAKATKLGHLLP